MIRIVLVLLESSEKIIILTKLVKMTSFKNKIHLGVDGLMVKASASVGVVGSGRQGGRYWFGTYGRGFHKRTS